MCASGGGFPLYMHMRMCLPPPREPEQQGMPAAAAAAALPGHRWGRVWVNQSINQSINQSAVACRVVLYRSQPWGGGVKWGARQWPAAPARAAPAARAGLAAPRMQHWWQ